MRLKILLNSLILFCFVIFSASFAHAVDDAILAVVNDEVITVKDLKEYMKNIYAQLRIEGRSPQEINEVMTQYENKGIDQLIEDRLILSAADKAGITIRNKAVDERIDDIKKKYPSTDAFLASINKEGLTISDIRKKIGDQIKGQGIVNTEVRSKIYVNPQEVTDYFTAHHQEYSTKARVYIQTVFIKSDFGKEEARVKIDRALEEAKAGRNFKELNQKYSDLPSVGEIALDQLRPEFRQRIDRMSMGDISDVIEVPEGFYLIKLSGRTDAAAAPLLDVKGEIYQQLYENKFRDRFKSWIEGLRKKAYVEVKS
jgi:parvulin-like peptidyl-prolyl isomerase